MPAWSWCPVRRALTLARAIELASAAHALGVRPVGVFRDPGIIEVAGAARTLELAAVQLHEQESEASIAALRATLSKECEIWAVGAVADELPQPRAGADRIIFDTAVDGRSGGTGRSFDWSRLRGRKDLASGLLVGGLKPANARAAAGVGAYAIDVGSGVEMTPGRKDAGKLHAFFEALRLPARAELTD